MTCERSFIGSRLGCTIRAASLAAALTWSVAAAGGASAQIGVKNDLVFGSATRPDPIKLSRSGFTDELLPVNINGFYGLINQRIRLTAPPLYDWTDDGFEGLARGTLDGKTGFLQGNGDWRFPPVFDELDRFQEGFAVFQGPGGGYGFLDQARDVRHQPEFNAALRFKDGRAAVQVGDRCGYLDLRMKLVTPLAFTAARSFHDGFAAVRLADNAAGPGAAGGHGEPDGTRGSGGDGYKPHAELVNVEIDLAEAQAVPQYNGRWAYLNLAGRLVFIDPTGGIEYLGDFNDNLACFQAGGKWGYLDQRFRVVVEPMYEDARDFTNGLAAVKLNGKWGYIDRRYVFVVPPQYEEADDFDETLAMVKAEGKIGFIDRTGRMAIPPQFDSAEPFSRGVARVNRDDSFAYIGINGYVFFDPRAAQNGIVDVRIRETARALSRTDRVPYNRFYELPPPRKTLPRPYPPEHIYDEGLDVSEPWQLGSKP
ncbi:MAG: WG repeat-containing protein [Planctomycetota bacterium]